MLNSRWTRYHHQWPRRSYVAAAAREWMKAIAFVTAFWVVLLAILS